MKAAVFNKKHDITVKEVPVPENGDDDVLIRVMACGICGTDVHIYNGEEGAAETTPPCILGHEFSGVIEKTGANVTTLSVGDRVSVDPNNTCGECGPCLQGKAHFCENMTGYGTTADGGFAEFCAVHYKQAYPIGDMPFELGAMAEPVACCLHATDLCGIRPGTNVLVLGGGTIGLIMLQLAKISGASKVVLSEPVAAKREMAEKLGADIVIDPFSQDIAAVLEENSLTNIDTAIECVGFRRTMLDAIKYAGICSTVMLFGLGAPGDEIPVKPFELFKREISLKTSFINPYTQQRALDLIASGRLDIASLIDRTIPLEELADVLTDGGKRSEGKVLVRP